MVSRRTPCEIPDLSVALAFGKLDHGVFARGKRFAGPDLIQTVGNLLPERFHLVLVSEVFPGFASAPNAQYVELQMYAPDQNFVMGQSILVFDATGGFVGQFAFSSSVSNGADQVTLLIATTQAQTLLGIVPDAVMDPVINPAGGKVCYTGSNDCVSWGSYSGSTVGVGSVRRRVRVLGPGGHAWEAVDAPSAVDR